MPRMVRLAALLTLLSCAAPAVAQPPAQLTYAAYAAGFTVLKLATRVSLGPQGYEVAVAGRTAGMAGAFHHADWITTARGVRSGGGARPAVFESRGRSGGAPRHVRIEYRPQVALTALEPEDDGYHEPVPAPLRQDTIDTLSAMAELLRAASATGRCEGAARVFDGRRLSRIVATTEGTQMLPPSARSAYAGPALRCAFEGEQLAGFARDGASGRARKPQRGVAWLAALSPGGPLLPVRVQFETRWLGAATLYLTGGFSGALPAPGDIP